MIFSRKCVTLKASSRVEIPTSDACVYKIRAQFMQAKCDEASANNYFMSAAVSGRQWSALRQVIFW
jgi:hypothetical protein